MTDEGRRALGADEQYCTSCGEATKKAAEICPKCGVRLQDAPQKQGTESGISEKGFVPTLILALLLGGLGVHRFYVGKVGTGVLMLLTLGGCGIWSLIDIVMIAVGNFTDSEGLPIKQG